MDSRDRVLEIGDGDSKGGEKQGGENTIVQGFQFGVGDERVKFG